MKTSTFLLAATITLSCTCCTQKATETESNTSENLSSKILVNGTEISYQLVGEGAYTLVFAHGWCINQSYWIDQVNAFKSNYQVLTLDLPGFGESGKNRPDWSIESYGNDLNEVINQLKLANVILIGHSMSGDIVLEAALNDPKIVAVIGVDTFKDVSAVGSLISTGNATDIAIAGRGLIPVTTVQGVSQAASDRSSQPVTRPILRLLDVAWSL